MANFREWFEEIHNNIQNPRLTYAACSKKIERELFVETGFKIDTTFGPALNLRVMLERENRTDLVIYQNDVLTNVVEGKSTGTSRTNFDEHEFNTRWYRGIFNNINQLNGFGPNIKKYFVMFFTHYPIDHITPDYFKNRDLHNNRITNDHFTPDQLRDETINFYKNYFENIHHLQNIHTYENELGQYHNIPINLITMIVVLNE